MPAETDSIFVKTTPAALFDFLADPDNLPRMLASHMFVQTDSIVPMESGGYRYKWNYKMLGKWLTANSETVEFERPPLFAVKSTGGVDTVSRWNLAVEGEGTRATFTIEYEMNNRLLARLTEGFVRNQIQYSVQVALLNIKELLERQAQPKPSQDEKDSQKSI